MKYYLLVSALLGSTFIACGSNGGGNSFSGQSSADGSSGITAAAGTTTSAGTSSGGATSAGAATTSGASAGTTSTGSLCDVMQMLRDRCQACHSNPPLVGVPMAMMTYDDLMAPNPSDSSLTVAQASLARMQDTSNPMPPVPATPATSAEVAVLQAWMDQGMPSTCDTGATTTDGGTVVANPYDTPVTCTSNTNWTGGNAESPNMRPGGACINCHSSGEGPSFLLAGTVYPSAHEPDDCNGSNGSTGAAQVIVTDANGMTISMNVNSVGNFYYQGRGASLAFPYQAKVVQNGLERVMVTPQTDGDCNSCHTESGDNMAPGRIMLP